MADYATSSERVPYVKRISRSAIPVLAGVGQIMFQNSALTGIFFLAGIAVASPLMAGGAAIGSLIGTLTAWLLRYDPQEIRDGLFGYNASLVGIAVLVFHQPVAIAVIIAIAGAAVSTVLTHTMRQRAPIPAYTAPFVVTTWLALYVAKELNVPAVVQAAAEPETGLPVTAAVVRGISEVMFQANVLTGVLFITGILLCSWKGAVWALVGSLLGLVIGMELNTSEQDLSLGIYGYNAALAAMGLALYRRSVLLPMVGAVLSTPITEKFPLLGLPRLTAPFVLSCWIVIALDKIDASLNEARKPTNPA